LVRPLAAANRRRRAAGLLLGAILPWPTTRLALPAGWSLEAAFAGWFRPAARTIATRRRRA
jgi:hypothetical protein